MERVIHVSRGRAIAVLQSNGRLADFVLTLGCTRVVIDALHRRNVRQHVYR